MSFGLFEDSSSAIFLSNSSKAPVDEDALVTDAEDILELELFCATAYPPDKAVLVIIDTTNASEASRTEDLVTNVRLII